MFFASFGGEKRLKNPGQDVGFDAAAVIADLDADVTPGGQSHVAVLGGFTQIEAAGLDTDPALSREGLERILEDLNERLLHFGFVEFGGIQFTLQLQFPLDGSLAGVLLQELDAATS